MQYSTLSHRTPIRINSGSSYWASIISTPTLLKPSSTIVSRILQQRPDKNTSFLTSLICDLLHRQEDRATLNQLHSLPLDRSFSSLFTTPSTRMTNKRRIKNTTATGTEGISLQQYTPPGSSLKDSTTHSHYKQWHTQHLKPRSSHIYFEALQNTHRTSFQ